MIGLAPHTEKLFEAVTKLECIKPYVLVGGTALSLQLGARMSEDLDFMSWIEKKGDKCEVAWRQIEKELSSIGQIQSMDILDIDHVEYIVDGVKLSFYACNKKSPIQDKIHIMNNLVLADTLSIGAMKMEVMLRRSNFRDYYDIYTLLREGILLQDMIRLASSYSNHLLKTKNLLAMLTNGARFNRDAHFELLQPKYKISPIEIEEYIKQLLKE